VRLDALGGTIVLVGRQSSLLEWGGEYPAEHMQLHGAGAVVAATS